MLTMNFEHEEKRVCLQGGHFSTGMCEM